jgi:hypothetical protein
VVASLGADNDVINGLVALELPETSAARAWGVSAAWAGVAAGVAVPVDAAVVAAAAGAGVAVAAGAADSSPIAARIASSHA